MIVSMTEITIKIKKNKQNNSKKIDNDTKIY